MKLKWIVIGIGGLAVAIIVAAAAVLLTLDLDEIKRVAERQVEDATGRELRIEGPVELGISLQPVVALEDVSLANAAWASEERMIRMRRLEVQAELLPLLSGEVRVQRIVLVEPRVLLERGSDGRANWQLETAAAQTSDQPAQEGDDTGGSMRPLQVDNLSVENAVVVWRDLVAKSEREFTVDELVLSRDPDMQRIKVDATGTLDGISYDLAGQLPELATVFAGGNLPFSLNGTVGGIEVTADGELIQGEETQRIQAAISAQGEDLSALEPYVGPVASRIGAFDLAGDVTQTPQSVQVANLSLKALNSDISGSLELFPEKAPPAIRGELKAGVIDLAALSALAPEGESPLGEGSDGTGEADASAKNGRYVFTDSPLPLDALGAANADITLAADRIILPNGLELSEAALGASLAGRKLKLSPLEAALAEGRLGGSLGLDASAGPPALDLVLKGEGVDYGQLLKDLEIENTVSGVLDLDVAVSGTGASPRALASSLDGHAEVLSDEGVIDNRLLKIVAVGLGEVLGPLLKGESDARLNCLVTRFDIKGGLAKSRAILLDSEVMTVSGGGTVDLRKETLDLLFDTRTRDASVASLAVPFRVTGTLAEPKVKPDPLGTAKNAAEAISRLSDSSGDLTETIGSLLSRKSDEGTQAAGTQENVCAAALSAVGETGEATEAAAPEPESPGEAPATENEDVVEDLEDTGKKVEEGLKNLFGD